MGLWLVGLFVFNSVVIGDSYMVYVCTWHWCLIWWQVIVLLIAVFNWFV